MPDKSWKRAERDTARVLGGERIPVTGRHSGDIPDVAHDRFAIEVKRRKSFPKWLKDAHLQAIAAASRAANNGTRKLPIVVVRPHRAQIEQSYVVMQVCDFVELSKPEGGE